MISPTEDHTDELLNEEMKPNPVRKLSGVIKDGKEWERIIMNIHSGAQSGVDQFLEKWPDEYHTQSKAQADVVDLWPKKDRTTFKIIFLWWYVHIYRHCQNQGWKKFIFPYKTVLNIIVLNNRAGGGTKDKPGEHYKKSC